MDVVCRSCQTLKFKHEYAFPRKKFISRKELPELFFFALTSGTYPESGHFFYERSLRVVQPCSHKLKYIHFHFDVVYINNLPASYEKNRIAFILNTDMFPRL